MGRTAHMYVSGGIIILSLESQLMFEIGIWLLGHNTKTVYLSREFYILCSAIATSKVEICDNYILAVTALGLGHVALSPQDIDIVLAPLFYCIHSYYFVMECELFVCSRVC